MKITYLVAMATVLTSGCVLTMLSVHNVSQELPLVKTTLPVILYPSQTPLPRPTVVSYPNSSSTKAIPKPKSQKPSAKPKRERVVEILISVNQQRLFATLSDGSLRTILCSSADTNKRNRDGTPVTNVFGAFTAIKKDADHWSGEFDCPMPYSIFFTRTRAIHATETDNYPALGNYPSSHGCIRVTLKDAKWLYACTALGTPVSIE